MNIFVVTYIHLDEFGGVEFVVDKAFTQEDQAHQYCKEQSGSDKYKVAYVVNKTSLDGE